MRSRSWGEISIPIFITFRKKKPRVAPGRKMPNHFGLQRAQLITGHECRGAFG
jgi:hypothetical protein